MTPSVYTVRASAWPNIFDCSHRFEGEHILGLKRPAGIRLHLGTSLHAGSAAFDSSRLPGARPISIDDATQVFVTTLRNPEREVDYSKDDITPRTAETIGISLLTRYCGEISPRLTFRSVEQPLDPLDIDCGDGMVVRLTGTMDRARVIAGIDGDVIADLKSGSRAIENGIVVTKTHVPQIGTYQILYERTAQRSTSGGQIIALCTAAKPRLGVSPLFDGKTVMLGTEDAPGLIQYAAAKFRRGLFDPNPASKFCTARTCARWDTCKFHG